MFLKAIVFFALVAVAIAARPRVGLRMPPILPQFSPQVVGGVEPPEGSYPFIVSLQNSSQHFCAGSILNKDWIITTGQCVQKVSSIASIRVKAGKHNLRKTEPSEQTTGVLKAYVHEKYQGGAGPYDLALLKLSFPLKLNERVQSIELAPSGSEPTGGAWLSGWGSISNSSTPIMPDVLQNVYVEYIDFKTCYEIVLGLIGSSPVHETNVCTGPLYNGKSACSGDAGGPLISMFDQKLTGIVSWGIIPCGTDGAPSVYTKISSFNEWIVKTMYSN